MATIIDFPTATGGALDESDLGWLGGYCLAKYEIARALGPGTAKAWREALREFADVGLAPPSCSLPWGDPRQLFLEAVNEERGAH